MGAFMPQFSFLLHKLEFWQLTEVSRIFLFYNLVLRQIILQIMYKSQVAHPASPYQFPSLSDSLSKQLDSLSLNSRKSSQTETVIGSGGQSYGEKSKNISKKGKNSQHEGKEKYHQINKKRQNTIKKLKYQQNRISELERQINSLRRNCQRCSYCHSQKNQHTMVLDDIQMIQQQELNRLAGDFYQRRNSRESIEFQAIDFARSLAYKTEMDDRAWVMIGTMMIIIGSKNMEVDGTINTFNIISDCVDNVRRQVQKSAQKICLDFYFLKEEMKQPNFMEGLDFDPFETKTEKTGLQLQGLKVDSVEQFRLVYDEKIKFSVNYDSLIATIEKLKQNCWVSI